jgi:hypothetical protein
LTDGAVEIAKDSLDKIPVSFMWILHIEASLIDSIGDVWPC